MYSKCRRVDAARRVFDSMLVRNIVSWNAVILGYCIHGCPDDGISLFHEMTEIMHCDDDYGGGRKERKRSKAAEQLVIPDEITFIGVLCACARGGLLSDGRSYFNQMSSVYNLKPKFAHYWCMANLYFGAGLVQEAEEVLRSMPGDEDGSSESSVWSRLLGSCRFRGDIELGERIAVHLIELEPQNSSHYSLLLNIYAVAGRWEEAAKVKTVMEENGMVKALGCSLVDLNEVVHDFTVGDVSRPGMDVVYTMLGELVRKLRLSTSGFTAIIANSWK
ncbi:hypothetical protein IFM89_036422 [Coptis chinensis]|uniref:Pentatricopeptide repeat-containing protein n=1 Tax=Coptis chinensis TaxID=261450 RepID=A0A835IGM7_9MAGN|nr:hypothetical protein IFM89_036422 [Coptis chinensis]